jgi:hypothetical protein
MGAQSATQISKYEEGLTQLGQEWYGDYRREKRERSTVLRKGCLIERDAMQEVEIHAIGEVFRNSSKRGREMLAQESSMRMLTVSAAYVRLKDN